MRGQAVFRDPGLTHRVHGKPKDASFQVIVLGASGGPREDTVTGLLVRAPHSEWRKGSMIAVDAGTHLSSIVRILQQQMPLYSRDIPPAGYSKILEDGPFAGVKCTGYSARSNALHIFREIMHAFLITHPHLDHLSAMGINTPALEYGREAKTIVALDSTIEAIKAHIFNDSIWPNLSDEGSGVGFVTYRRLKEGGNHRLGIGDARGYVRVCESLATLCMGVTHGKCKAKPVASPHHRNDPSGWHDAFGYPSHVRRLSRISNDHESYFAAVHSHGQTPSFSGAYSHVPSGQITPGFSMHTPTMSAIDLDHPFDPVKSSAFFILNEETAAEILIFGDIEPDAVSMSPQNYKVWRTAAPKVANGNLKAMFIECSYDDSVKDSDLYGHLCPRHLIDELLFLAKEVADYKAARRADTPLPSTETKRAVEFPVPSEAPRKRKKTNGGIAEQDSEMTSAPIESNRNASINSSYVGTRSATAHKRKTSLSAAPLIPGDVSPISLRGNSPSRGPTKHVHFTGANTTPRVPGQAVMSPSPATQPVGSISTGVYEPLPRPTIDTNTEAPETPPDPLKGLTVHIIHVKDTLMDGPSPGETILNQLNVSAAEAGLQCDFDITDFGESIWI